MFMNRGTLILTTKERGCKSPKLVSAKNIDNIGVFRGECKMPYGSKRTSKVCSFERRDLTRLELR